MKLLLPLLLLLSFNAFASEDDHPMTQISGTNVQLQTAGHTMAGSIGSKIFFGDVYGPGHATASMTIKDGHDTINATFSLSNESTGGSIVSADKTTEVKLGNVSTETSEVTIIVDGVSYVVRIDADEFSSNHFHNPTYSTIIDGKDFSFTLKDSKACWRFSIQIVSMVLGTYLH